MFDTYKPSGQFGIATPLLFLVGLPVVIGLAYIYQLVLYWVPFIYVNFFATLFFGGAIAFVGRFVVRNGHCRNPTLTFGMMVLYFFVGMVAKFCLQYVTMGFGASLLEHLQIRAEEGFNIGRGGRNGIPITGIFVYLLWAVEAGIVFFTSFSLAVDQSAEPYSESKGQWADEVDRVMTLPISDPEMVEKITEAQTVEELLDIPIPKTDQSSQFAVYTVNSIAGDELEDAYLTVELTTTVINSDGEPESEAVPLVEHAVLTTAMRKQLIENAELLNEALTEYRNAVNEETIASAEAVSDIDPEMPAQ